MTGSPKIQAQAAGTSYPSSYSLVEQGLVTPVKNQEPYGTCWTFAAIACMEHNALMQGFGTYDLSEAQLGYFMFHNPTKQAPGLEGDYVIYNEAYGDWFEQGGNNLLTTRLLAKGYGPVLEEEVPYSSVTTQISDKYAYGHNAFSLKAAYIIEVGNTKEMKKAIMNYGGITMSVKMSESKKDYNSTTASLYVKDKSVIPNHDVCVVGWDDNYSRENFGKNKPAKDGAWLCKNSYGEKFGLDGYFWVSYEDKAANRAGMTCQAFVLGAKDTYNVIYQYDGGGSDATVKGVAAANIFKARAKEKISAVQIMNCKNGTKATICIYTGVSKGNPESGKLVLSQNVDLGTMGYDTVKLSKGVTVKKGQKFSVCVKYSETSKIHLDRDQDFKWIAFDIQAKDGQSYVRVSESGKWISLGEGANSQGIEANVRIKALGTTIATEDEPILEAPSNLSISSVNGQVTLKWKKSEGATKYLIYRKELGGKYSLSATLGNTKTYVDRTVQTGKTYYYKIKAVSSDGVKSEASVVKKILVK